VIERGYRDHQAFTDHEADAFGFRWKQAENAISSMCDHSEGEMPFQSNDGGSPE
jgi:hypothetical protein